MSQLVQNLCVQCDCRPIENRDTGLCATCGAAIRKAERRVIKEKKPINKVSDKRNVQLQDYAPLRDKYLFDHPDCEYHGKGCASQVVHHAGGRVGFIDDYAREHNIPALVDVRYFRALCHPAHEWATENSREAIEAGISVLRTI